MAGKAVTAEGNPTVLRKGDGANSTPSRNAQYQARWREKTFRELEALRTQTRHFLHVLADAAERGRSVKLTNNLPEDPAEALAELSRRLDGRRVIDCAPEAPGRSHKKRKRPGGEKGAEG